MKPTVRPAAGVVWLICLLAAINVVIYTYSPLGGDDWVYKGAFEGPQTYSDSWLSWPHWAAGHWFAANGRALNLLLPLLLALPRWLTALTGGVMTGLMFYMGLKCCHRAAARSFTAVVFICCLAWVLPWWDSMTILACQTNYIWATAIILWAFYIITEYNFNRGSLIWSIPLCLLAGASHEGATLPLTLGLLFYAWLNRSKLDKLQKFSLVAFIAGTVFVTFSPGIIMRAGDGMEPDDPLLPLMLKTVPAVLLMVIIVCIMATGRSGRKRLTDFAGSPGIAFAVAAVVSSGISLMSGIVGRSGWFAEVYALIVIFDLCCPLRGKEGRGERIVALLLGLLLIAQTSLVALWQMWLGREFKVFEKIFTTGNEEVVFMQYTRDTNVPSALLGRFAGVPDPDDVYLLKTFGEYYRPGAMPVILPAEASNLPYGEPVDTVLPCGDIITSTLPGGTRVHSTDREKIDMYLLDSDSGEIVVRPFSRGNNIYYHLSKRILDPGDR